MSTVSTELDLQSIGYDHPQRHSQSNPMEYTITEQEPIHDQTDYNEDDGNIGEYFERRARVPPTRLSQTSDQNGSVKEVHFAHDNQSFVGDGVQESTFVRDKDRGEENPPTFVRGAHIGKVNPGFTRDSDVNDVVFHSKDQGLDRSTHVQEKERETDKKRRSKKIYIWIIVVVLLIILLVVMTSLFIWRMLCCKTDEDSKPPKISKPVPSVANGCKYLPRPIEFGTLPVSIKDELDNFTSFLQQAIKNKEAVAISTNIVYRDKVIWEKGFGTLNRTDSPARVPAAKTVYPVASVSKVLTALMLFKLENDGSIVSLDDAVNPKYDSTFSVRNSFGGDKITLRNLVSQRSGLPREAPCYPSTSTNLCPYDYAIMMNRLKNVSLVLKPGTIPRYSNLAIALLGQLLAKKFGKNFNKWMKDELLSKIGMSDSSFSIEESQKKNIPVGYLSRSSTSHQIQEWGWLEPAGGLFTSVHDLAKLQVELMTDKASGRILSDLVTEEFFRPNYIFSDGRMTGTPWEMEFRKGYMLRAKGGSIYGYKSNVVMVPEIRLGLNLLCTGCDTIQTSVNSHFHRILSAFNEELTRASVKKFSKPQDPKQFIGRYNSSVPDIKLMEVKAHTSFMTLEVNGAPIFLLNYTKPLTFRIVIHPFLNCLEKYTLGVNNDQVIFDKPATPGGLSPGFTMHDAEPAGLSYFPRI